MTRPEDPDLVAGYEALGSGAGVVARPRDMVRVSGPDAADYLQGQCSQDVVSLATGASADALLLSPQGKVEVYFRATRTGADDFVLDTDRGFGPTLVTRLERFRLRSKVTFEPLTWWCVAVRGPDAGVHLVGSPILVVDAAFASLAGVDLVGPEPEGGLDAWVGSGATRCSWPAWEARRIEAGMPVNGQEVVAGTIAAELGLVDRTVSFVKGCFTGQELVARLDARGSKVARHLRGVVLDTRSGAPVPPGRAGSLIGAAVTTEDGEHQVGTVSSAAWSPGLGAPVALAVLHRRVGPGDAVVVHWAGTGESRPLRAEARSLPIG